MTDTRTIIDLSGQWDLVFDDKLVGKDQEWFLNYPAKKAVKMAVPGVWEQVRPFFDGVGWYRTSFQAPAEWKAGAKSVRVKFGAAAYLADVWLNGKYLGQHEGGYSPFEFEIARKLHAGANELVVRVLNPPFGREIEGFRAGAPLNQGDLPTGKGAWYFNFGGLWQEVELIVCDAIYVKDVYVQPHPAQKKAVVNITVRNNGDPRSATIVCQIASRGSEGSPVITKTLRKRLDKGDNQFTFPVRFAEVHLWSPEDPHLYVATVKVEGKGTRKVAGTCDEYAARFGMREFTIKSGLFQLNGKKIQLLGFLQQGMYPRTLCYPHSREFARKELQMLKDNGFNFVRAHLKPTNPWYLDLYDEMGFIVEAEPAIGWIGNSPQTERRCRENVEEMIVRDRNHPSIVLWCLMNEAYHFRGFKFHEIMGMVTRLGKGARALDPSRLLMDTSGGTGDPNEIGSKVYLPYVDKTAQMLDVHGYCSMPLEDKSIVHYRTMGTAGVPMLNSEYGAPDVPPNYAKVLATYTPAERKLGLEDYKLHKDFYDSLKEQFAKAGLKKIFGSADKMIPMIDHVRADEMRLITMAQRANPKLGGLALCQLADASGELFGAVDVWREPKQIWGAMVASAKSPLLVPEVLPRLSRPGQALSVRATLVNGDKIGPQYDWKADLVSSGGAVAQSFSGTVTAAKEVQTVLLQKVKADLAPGQYTLRCVLTAGGQTLSDEGMEFTVQGRSSIKTPHVAVWEPGTEVRDALKRMGVKTDTFSNGTRNKDIPILMDLRKGFNHRGLISEYFGQLKKITQLGGCAILFEPEPTQLYEWYFPKYIRIQGIMRLAGYVMPHPIFEGVPSSCIVGYEYADLMPTKMDKCDDIVAAGGKVLFGGFSSHMWTRPAVYFWAAGVYAVPIGRGTAIVCNLKVLDHLGTNPIADRIFANLIDFAATQVKPGLNHKLLNRCIDPLKPSDYA